MFSSFVNFLLEWTSGMGYAGVFILMVVESSFIPFPSELVIPPAAYLAFRGEMSFWLVVFWGIGGSLVGAAINYYLAMWLGRPLVYSLTEKRWTSVFLINSKKVERAEKYFLKFGGISTFLGRLVPVVRQLISLPAGFVRMNFLWFIFYTFLGAGVWILVLAMLGWFFGANQQLLNDYFSQINTYLLIIVPILAFFAVSLILSLKRRQRSR